MFNDIDRDELIDECLNFPSGELRPLARYVAATYPDNMIA